MKPSPKIFSSQRSFTKSINNMYAASSAITFATHYINALTQKFWQQEGTLQSYVEFMLCEFNPMLSRQRTAAEVIQVITETHQAETYVLRPASQWKGFQAGQYINIEVEINGCRYRRNYSVSSTPEEFEKTGIIRITVKRVEEGLVSNYLRSALDAGDIIHISPAGGDFVLKDTPNKSLFLAAGSGITPILSMIERLALDPARSETTLIYSAHNPEDIIFSERLSALSESIPDFKFIPHITRSEGHLTTAAMKAYCADIQDRSLYLCGPNGFMESMNEHAVELGVPKEAIKQESFGAPSTNVTALDLDTLTDLNSQTHFSKSGKKIQSDGEKTLLELAESAGLKPKYGCRNGICHECKCTKTKGQMLNKLTGEFISEEQSQVQACIAIPLGNVSISNL